MFTRAQIESITVGKTKIAHSINGSPFSEPALVTEISARQHDICGKLFVCGYREFGANASISFSIKEGDALDAKSYRISE